MYTSTHAHTYSIFFFTLVEKVRMQVLFHSYVSWWSTLQLFALEQSVKPLQEHLGLQYTFSQVALCLCKLISRLKSYSSLFVTGAKHEHIICIWMSGSNLLVVLIGDEGCCPRLKTSCVVWFFFSMDKIRYDNGYDIKERYCIREIDVERYCQH